MMVVLWRPQVKFPPNIYYKIFTRRPVLDLCACSPRDYTAMSNRRQQARERNNIDARPTHTNGTMNL
jgi:hypothetical protein